MTQPGEGASLTATEAGDAMSPPRVASVELFRALAESSPDGLLVVAPDGSMLLANQRFGEVWGFAAEVIASGDDEIALAEAMKLVADPESFIAEVRDCYEDPTHARRQLVHLRDGRVLDRHGMPLHDAEDTYVGWAWYFRDVTEEHQARGDLQRLAQTLQSTLLPPRPPAIPGMEVAVRYRTPTTGIDVGGDFYDVFRLSANTWGIVVGDVCGKGAEAAALTSLARYTMRAAAQHDPRPTAVLGELNAALLEEEAMGERFVAAVYASLEQGTCGAWVTLSCGGHPLPVVIRRAGWVDVRGQAGSLLGLFPEISVDPDRVGLGPGDALLFCTDGITEARGEDGEIFADEAMHAVLLECAAAGCDAEEIADRVLYAAQLHSEGRLHDDVAMIVVRVPGEERDAGDLRARLGMGPDEDLPDYPVGESDWGSATRPAPPREARMTLRPDPAAVPEARRFLAGVLHSWRMPEMVDGDAALLVSELVGNAVRHADGPFAVLAFYDGSRVRVEVGDASRAVPVVRHASHTETGGRGVYLVSTIAEDWGVQPTANGKRVWFELLVPPPGQASETSE